MATHKRAALRQAIGERLAGLRRERGGFSQEALASRAGLHRTYVGRLERAESGVTVDTLAAVLAPMGISLAEFFRPFTRTHSPKTPRRRE